MPIDFMIPLILAQADSVGALSGNAGWAGAGLLGLVIAWLCLVHIPATHKQFAGYVEAKDKQITDLIDSRDAFVRELTHNFRDAMQAAAMASAAQDKERRDDYKSSLATVVAHCEKETGQISQAIRKDLSDLVSLVVTLRQLMEEVEKGATSDEGGEAMIYLIWSLIVGELILYFVFWAANRDPSQRPASLGWFYLLLCLGLFGMSGASFLAYVDTGNKLKVLDAAGVRYLAVRDVLGSLKDMEIGQRGFLLTGRPSYAEPYQAALAALPKQVNAVRLAYADSGDEARIEDLIKLAGIKVEELRKAFELREQGKSDEALAVLESDRGKNTMDLFRISADELAKKNKTNYNATKAELRYLAAVRIWMAMSVMAGAVLQMVLVVFGRKRLARTAA